MFCPNCGDEYQRGFERCARCDAALVENLPVALEPPPLKIVTVLAAGDDTKIEMARSLLDAAGIGYWVKGERLQDLFGAGRLGPGYNVAIGPILLQVDAQDAEAAIAVLQEIGPGPDGENKDKTPPG
jgi:hypothetical protein